MEKDKIDQFMMVNGKNFPEEAQIQIREKLEKIDDKKADLLVGMEWKSPTVAFLFAFFLGGLGVDRFWLGENGLGVAKILTCAGVGIWGLVDLFTAAGRAKKYNLRHLYQVIM